MNQGQEANQAILSAKNSKPTVWSKKSLKLRLKKYIHSNKALFEHNPDVIWWMNSNGSILSMNSKVEKVFGFSKTRFVSHSYDRLFADKDADAVVNSFKLAVSGQPQSFESAFIHKEGHVIELRIFLVPVIVDYKIVGVYGIARDITEQKKSQAALKESNELIGSILGSITDGFIAIGSDWRITYWNKEAERITGKKRDDILGADLWDGLPHSFKSLIYMKLRKAMYQQVTVKHEFYAQCSDQWYSVHVYPSKNGLSLYLHDITERKKAEQQINHMTYYDSLTGLPNQRLFKERLNHSLTYAESNSDNIAVLVLDLDRFNLVNDSLGYDQGDMIMVAISKRLASCVREDDTVSRLEGDNFAILLRNVERVQTKRIAKRILEEFQQPFVLNNMEIVITPSIGVSFYPTDGNQGGDLLANADTAMRRAKLNGKNNYQFYMQGMNAPSSLTMERELRKALKRNELLVYYQPQVDIQSGKVMGCEALIRWKHPKWGMVFPDKFIPLAEETGLIDPISEWVLRTACVQNKAWQDMGYTPITISVNLSPRQFLQNNIVGLVKKVLEQTGLEPRYLDLEIIESMMMDVDRANKTLKGLKSLGVSISMDDFGKGYSSLFYLKRFPIDTLKIDQTFVRECTIDANDATIVKTIISMAHNLNLKVIAEGVEKKEHLLFLQQNLCNEAQGYLFSKPAPAEELEQKFIQIQEVFRLL